MTPISKSDLDSALMDVRKAYRLLYAYQRRIMDTAKFISDTLSKNVLSGWAIYSGNAPRSGGKINLDCWAWDWLNMYMYEFYFGEESILGDKIQFAIMVQSDTGPYDSDKVEIGTEIEYFSPAEESETRLIFQLGKNRWKPLEYHDCDFFSSKTSNVYKVIDNESTFFVAKSYPLSFLINEDGILQTLEDFIKFSNQLNVNAYFGESILIKN